jgi:uncharacterized membrane protein YfcA
MLGYLFAIAIGLSLGLIGGGGSILAVPTLVYIVGVSAKEAIAMSLFVVGAVSLLGAFAHWKAGNVNFRTAALFAPVAMVGSYLGARLAGLPFVNDSFQLVAFGAVMVIASALMILKKDSPKDSPTEVEQTADHNHSHLGGIPTWLAIPVEGLVVGIVTGFVGVGGGFLIIPALVLLGGLPMKQAVGTSLLIIAFKSATGFWGYLGQVTLDWQVMIGFTVASALGTVAGVYLSRYVDGKHLQKGFGYFVLAVAVFVLINR